MKELTKEQLEFARGKLQLVIESRGLTQTQLEKWSGVKQSTISKILKRQQDPNIEVLKKLCRAIGLKLSDVLGEAESLGHEIIGYLATPLTGLSTVQDRKLLELVEDIKRVVSSAEFVNPGFDLYWPGDHTH